MGKSHLLGEVFPTLATQYGAQWTTCDLAPPTPTIFAILRNACDDLGTRHFRSYYPASQKRAADPTVVFDKVSLEQSTITTTITQDAMSDFQQKFHNLTGLFVNDIRGFSNRMVVFFVDHMDTSVKCVPEITQTWLMHTFLKQLVSVPHVRVVVAGSSLPNAPTGYTAFCEPYQLKAVKQLKEYISYCQQCGIKYEEETIEAIAILSMHRPGYFAENMRIISYYKQGL